ncbi:hypothetical protein AVEN_89527-1 [Araneus ventricosus]|uniref:Uncharacterized protein n=1 Tax=Araneus ventricosus TaxID=182803 RepID=A0A4Y2KJK1_ARAVE|nr:hypothetical protein AVEN_89527-1 [Araneus ventricosus]
MDHAIQHLIPNAGSLQGHLPSPHSHWKSIQSFNPGDHPKAFKFSRPPIKLESSQIMRPRARADRHPPWKNIVFFNPDFFPSQELHVNPEDPSIPQS